MAGGTHLCWDNKLNKIQLGDIGCCCGFVASSPPQSHALAQVDSMPWTFARGHAPLHGVQDFVAVSCPDEEALSDAKGAHAQAALCLLLRVPQHAPLAQTAYTMPAQTKELALTSCLQHRLRPLLGGSWEMCCTLLQTVTRTTSQQAVWHWFSQVRILHRWRGQIPHVTAPPHVDSASAGAILRDSVRIEEVPPSAGGDWALVVGAVTYRGSVHRLEWPHPTRMQDKAWQAAEAETANGIAAVATAAAAAAVVPARAVGPFTRKEPAAGRLLHPCCGAVAEQTVPVVGATRSAVLCASWRSHSQLVVGLESGALVSINLDVPGAPSPSQDILQPTTFVASLLTSFLGEAAGGGTRDPCLAVQVTPSVALAVHQSGTLRLWDLVAGSVHCEDSLLQGAQGGTSGQVFDARLWKLPTLQQVEDVAMSTVLQVAWTDTAWSAAYTLHATPAPAGWTLRADTLGGFNLPQTGIDDVCMLQGCRVLVAGGAVFVMDGTATLAVHQPGGNLFTGVSAAETAYEDGAELASTAALAGAAASAIVREAATQLGGEVLAADVTAEDVRAAHLPWLGWTAGIPCPPELLSHAVLPPSPTTAPSVFHGQPTVSSSPKLQRVLAAAPSLAQALVSVELALGDPEAIQAVPWELPLPSRWSHNAMTQCKSQLVAAADTLDSAMLARLALGAPAAAQGMAGRSGILSLAPPLASGAARYSDVTLLGAACMLCTAFSLPSPRVELELPESVIAALRHTGSRSEVLKATSVVAEASLRAAQALLRDDGDWDGEECVQVATVDLASLLLQDETPPLARGAGQHPTRLPQPLMAGAFHPALPHVLDVFFPADITRGLLAAVHGVAAALYVERVTPEAVQDSGHASPLVVAASVVVETRAQAWALALEALETAAGVWERPMACSASGRLLACTSTTHALSEEDQADPRPQSVALLARSLPLAHTAVLRAAIPAPAPASRVIPALAKGWEAATMSATAVLPEHNLADHDRRRPDLLQRGTSARALGAMLAAGAVSLAASGEARDAYVRLAATVGGEDVHPLVLVAREPLHILWQAVAVHCASGAAILPAIARVGLSHTSLTVPSFAMAGAGSCNAAREELATLAAAARQAAVGAGYSSVDDALQGMLGDVLPDALLTGLFDSSATVSVKSVLPLASVVPALSPQPADTDGDVHLHDLEGRATASVLAQPCTGVDAVVTAHLPGSAAVHYNRWLQGSAAVAVDAAADGSDMSGTPQHVQSLSVNAAGVLACATAATAHRQACSLAEAAFGAALMHSGHWVWGSADPSLAPLEQDHPLRTVSIRAHLPPRAGGPDASGLLATCASSALTLAATPARGLLAAAGVAASVTVWHDAGQQADMPSAAHVGSDLRDVLSSLYCGDAASTTWRALEAAESPTQLHWLLPALGRAAPLMALSTLGQQSTTFHSAYDIGGTVQDSDALVALMGHTAACAPGAPAPILRSASLAYAATSDAQNAPSTASSSSRFGPVGLGPLVQAFLGSHSLLVGGGGVGGGQVLDAASLLSAALGCPRHPVGLQLLSLTPTASSGGGIVASSRGSSSLLTPTHEASTFDEHGMPLQRHISIGSSGAVHLRVAGRSLVLPPSAAEAVVVSDVDMQSAGVSDSRQFSTSLVDGTAGVGRGASPLWAAGACQGGLRWGTDADLDPMCLSAVPTDAVPYMVGVRSDVWQTTALAATQQLRRGTRMWQPHATPGIPQDRVEPSSRAWQQAAECFSSAVPPTAIMAEGSSVLETLLLCGQAALGAAAAATELAASQASEGSALADLIIGEDAPSAAHAADSLQGQGHAIHTERGRILQDPLAPAASHRLVHAAMAVWAPPLACADVEVERVQAQQPSDLVEEPGLSDLDHSPLPTLPVLSMAASTPLMHALASLRQYPGLWTLGGSLAAGTPNAPVPAVSGGARQEASLLAVHLLRDTGRHCMLASSMAAGAIADALASHGSTKAASAVVHAVSSALLGGALPNTVALDKSQAAVRSGAHASSVAFSPLQLALGPMFTPPDDLHDVPETVTAISLAAGASASAQRLESPGATRSETLQASDFLHAWRSSVQSSLEGSAELLARPCGLGLAQSSAAASSPTTAGGAIAEELYPSALEPAMALPHASRFVAFSWRVRSAQLFHAATFLQALRRGLGRVFEAAPGPLPRRGLLRSADCLDPLTNAVAAMRCVCNEKARARHWGYFLRDTPTDDAESGAPQTSVLSFTGDVPPPPTLGSGGRSHTVGRHGAPASFVPGVDTSALAPAAQGGVPPPPPGSLSLARMDSSAMAEGAAADRRRRDVESAVQALLEDRGTVGRLRVAEGGAVVDDDVAVLAAATALQVDLAVDAQDWSAAVAAATSQPLPSAAEATLAVLAGTLLENRRVPDLVNLQTAPRVWAGILENLAWRARTAPVPLSASGAHMPARQGAVFPTDSDQAHVPLDAAPLLAGRPKPGSHTAHVQEEGACVDVNAYSVLAAVATAQGRWVDAAGWQYAWAYRLAAATQCIAEDLVGVSTATMEAAVARLVGHCRGEESASRDSAAVHTATAAVSTMLSALHARAGALDSAVAALANVPTEHAYLLTLDTAARGSVESGELPSAVQVITAQDVALEAAFVRGQCTLLQTALQAEAAARPTQSEAQRAALVATGVLDLLPGTTLSDAVAWGPLVASPPARAALCAIVAITSRLWLPAALRQRGVVWMDPEQVWSGAGGPADLRGLTHLAGPDGVPAASDLASALVREALRMAAGLAPCLPCWGAGQSPMPIGMPIAPVQLALCEIGAYESAAFMSYMAQRHHQPLAVSRLRTTAAARPPPLSLPVGEVLAHGSRAAAMLSPADHTLSPAAPTRSLACDRKTALEGRLASCALRWDGAPNGWKGTLMALEDSLMDAAGNPAHPAEWALDLAVWGTTPAPASFSAQVQAAVDCGGRWACGNPLGALRVLWAAGRADASARVALSVVPEPAQASQQPLALTHAVPQGTQAGSPTDLLCCTDTLPPLEWLSQVAVGLVGVPGEASALGRQLQGRLQHAQAALVPALEAQRRAKATEARHALARATAEREGAAATIAASHMGASAEATRQSARSAADAAAVQATLNSVKDLALGWKELVDDLHGGLQPEVDSVSLAIAQALQEDTVLPVGF